MYRPLQLQLTVCFGFITTNGRYQISLFLYQTDVGINRLDETILTVLAHSPRRFLRVQKACRPITVSNLGAK